MLFGLMRVMLDEDLVLHGEVDPQVLYHCYLWQSPQE
jgi:hypothetical protein